MGGGEINYNPQQFILFLKVSNLVVENFLNDASTKNPQNVWYLYQKT